METSTSRSSIDSMHASKHGAKGKMIREKTTPGNTLIHNVQNGIIRLSFNQSLESQFITPKLIKVSCASQFEL